MREFILRARKAKTDHKWALDHLVNAGHMEIVCDCITNALCFSNHLRNDTVIHVVMEGGPRPPIVISIDGETVKGLSYPQQEIAKLLQFVLQTKIITNEPTKVHPGITICKKSFEALVQEKLDAKQEVFFLSGEGTDIRQVKFSENPVFVFGDYIGMPDKSERLLERRGVKPLSLGPIVLFASHCVVLVHNELDRAV